MTRLILIRHGQSMANLEEIYAGITDAPLTDLGKAQAYATAAYLAENYHIDKIYASDLQRAFCTGKALGDRLGLPVTPDQQLREINAGAWEGVSFVKLMAEDAAYAVWMTDIGNSVCPDGESVAEVQQRIVAAIKRIAGENDGKTVAIATHATPIRTLQCHCEGKTLKEMQNIPWVSNASVTVVDYENDTLTLVAVGYDAHLGESRTALPENV